MILRLPWLSHHNPTIDWTRGRVQFTSDYCNSNCLPVPNDIFAKQESLTHKEVEGYSVDLMPHPTEGTLKAMIPKEYHNFVHVFNPEGPMHQLPRHNQVTTLSLSWRMARNHRIQ